jgi:hypothetical protein
VLKQIQTVTLEAPEAAKSEIKQTPKAEVK